MLDIKYFILYRLGVELALGDSGFGFFKYGDLNFSFIHGFIIRTPRGQETLENLSFIELGFSHFENTVLETSPFFFSVWANGIGTIPREFIFGTLLGKVCYFCSIHHYLILELFLYALRIIPESNFNLRFPVYLVVDTS